MSNANSLKAPMIRIALSVALTLAISAASASAQDGTARTDKGYITASFETNTTYYIKDSLSGAVLPENHLGTNNYLKVDYYLGGFSGGIQYEAYLPALQGYPIGLDGVGKIFKYAAFKDDGFSIRIGDFYGQFGSGLLYRSWEERSIGINTSLEGADIGYSFKDIFSVRGIIGRPRIFMDYGSSRISGADASLSVSNLLGWNAFGLALEGSALNKYEAVSSSSLSANVPGFSERIVLELKGFSLKGEAVQRNAAPAVYNMNSDMAGKAYLVEAQYRTRGFGALLTFRQLQNMQWQSARIQSSSLFTQLNYIPALTQQHTYMLASLNPYQPDTFDEIGGQCDLYYAAPKHTWIGGKYGSRFHVNASRWYGKTIMLSDAKRDLLFNELCIDFERKWNRSWKTILLYSWQVLNPYAHPTGSKDNISSHTAVADVTWKIDNAKSLRFEAQHLYTRQDKGNWLAGLVEFSIAPEWTFSVADMWNYGSSKLHYYNGTVAYSHSHVRAALSFGRFKEGYQCAGGVCRIIPAYTGMNASITASF
jgi:hypothetical protein